MARARAARLEALEHRRLLLFRDAEAGILHADGDAVLFAAAGKGDGPIFRREVDGVREEVVKHLNEAIFVRHDRRRLLGDVDVEMQPGPRQALAHAELGGLDGLLQVDLRKLQIEGARVDNGQVQDVVDDIEQVLA